ncbi:MAG: pyridoxal-phosphate dependent enzyme [Chitinophagaceae bacterium]|nr:pyridoxal-phosphate dependent enzyme [Chitinophagaceae bacterium]
MNFDWIQQINEKLFIFRDDLFPFLGGGNKGRKMKAVGLDVFSKKANAIVTTGGVQSNHCRAAAVFAAQNKLECSLVLHGSAEDFYKDSGNAKIMRMSGSKIIFASAPAEIGTLMNAEMKYYEERGLKPYYIWGGAHTMEGGGAYIDAVAELKDYCVQSNWHPDLIFLASGTGSTQAGLMAGLDKFGFENTAVVGMSIARRSAQATEIVAKFYQDLCAHYNIKFTNQKAIVVDDYLFGGYEKYDSELKAFSDSSIRDYGFILDTCYSGKAFYGMLQYIRKYDVTKKNILFWHTGGVLNFLAR